MEGILGERSELHPEGRPHRHRYQQRTVSVSDRGSTLPRQRFSST